MSILKAVPSVFIGLLTAFSLETASAREHDLKPYLGGALESAIASKTPSTFRERVTTEKLTIDNRGTVRGTVKVKYRHRVKTPFGKKTLWEATVRVHFTSYFANGSLTYYRVDVGNYKGVINTNSIKNHLIAWVKTQAHKLRRFVDPPQVVNQRPPRIHARIFNQADFTVHYTIIATGSGGKVEQNRLNSGQNLQHSWPGGMTIRYFNGMGAWREVKVTNGWTYTFKRLGRGVELYY